MGLIDTDLSFDPRDPYFPVPGAPGVEWALQVFTTTNGYGLTSARLSEDGKYSILNGTSSNRIVLGASGAGTSDLIAWAGNAQYSALAGATWSLSVIAAYFNTTNSITWDITGRRFSVGSAGSNTVTSFRLARHQTTSTRRFNGDICELAIWARALPADELGSLARDLAAKWGI